MFSMQKASAAEVNNNVDTTATNTETLTFDDLMTLDAAVFSTLTNELASSILNLDDQGNQNLMREIVKTTQKKDPQSAAILQSFISTPTPEAFHITSDETILENAQKGTEHHTLYKAMLACSAEQKAQLIEKFGVTLTKFAVCNLIFLYTEGSKIDTEKGIRNVFAMARKGLEAAFAMTDRDLKLEFFTQVLKELDITPPFLRYKNESFVSATHEKSRYKRAKDIDDAGYLSIIMAGRSVNVPNALTLFDPRTLAIVTNKLTGPAYTSGTQGMFPPVPADSTGTKSAATAAPPAELK